MFLPKTKSKIALFAAAALIAQTVVFAGTPAYAAEGALTYQGEEIITAGAVLKKFNWSNLHGSTQANVEINAVEVALNNPLVKLDVMTGVGGNFTQKQSVRKMAAETGAVAGINGDFFNTQAEGVPDGPEIMNGKLLATPPFLPGLYSFAIDKNNKPVIDLFTFQGAIKAKDGATTYLGGVNKTYYWFEPNGEHSMINGLFMYTDAWAQIDRSNDGVTVPTEVLVQNGVIKQIAQNAVIQQIPPKDGYILRASGTAADFVMAHLKVGDPITAYYAVVPQDPTKQYDVKNFKTMIGGHSILLDNGQPASSRNFNDIAGSSYRARTAVGYTKDSNYAYLIATDIGVTLKELQTLMQQMGIWKAMVLDGGGSTQMVARPLGETVNQLVNTPENGSFERPIVNGLGVWSTAPKGQPKGLKVVGNTSVFINEKTSFQVKGYDEFYNPITTGAVTPQWSVDPALGSFNGNVFTATRKGTAVVTAVSGQARQSANIHVIGREDIEAMTINASNTVLSDNSDIKVSVTVKLKGGKTRVIPGDSFQWELRGISGNVVGDNVHIGSANGAASAQLIARYDGFSSILTLNSGFKKLFADFDNANYPITFSATPNEVKGEVARINGLPGLDAGNNAVQLKYDMKLGTGTKVAYVNFGEGAGVPVPGSPSNIEVKVLGDNSLNMLRAEIIDAAGAKKMVDLARVINWTGWKNITADLSAYKLTYPVKLSRIYVANPAESQDERAAVGTVGFDDISFQYQNASASASRNQVKLTIDNPMVSVNGKGTMVDQAPYIISGNTMVPIRFITEALAGEVKWNGNERKVTVFRGDHMVDLWLGNPNLIVDGSAITAEVAPALKNQLSMVPLRVLSENLGWKVTWDGATRTVMLE